ncbi:MAG: hypothetical protein ACRBFS_08565 [Aureispira sp.]
MYITTIELKHSNPSMGPHEHTITYTIQNQSSHEQEFEQLLQGSTINRSSFLDFLAAHQAKDQTTLQAIFAAYQPRELSEGATISKLTLTLEGGHSIILSDLRKVSLGGYYSTFIRYLVAHGTKNESSSKAPNLIQLRPNRPVVSKEAKGNHLTDS